MQLTIDDKTLKIGSYATEYEVLTVGWNTVVVKCRGGGDNSIVVLRVSFLNNRLEAISESAVRQLRHLDGN